MTGNFDYWRAEIAKPGSMDRDTLDKTDGRWRIVGARTKPDYPVAIWHEGDVEFIKIGRKEPFRGDSEEGQQFRQWGWLKCAAVSQAEYDEAVDTGFWADQKTSRAMSDEERLGVDVEPGGNNPPKKDVLEDRIHALVDKANNMPEPTTQEEANAATQVVDDLRQLWKLADAERDAEKRPHDNAAKAVQAKWLEIMDPAREAGKQLDERRKNFLKKEQARLDAIAREEQRKREAEALAEQERVAEELRQRAAEAGEDPEAVEVPEVAVQPVEAPRASARGSFGRASGLRKVPVGVIEDPKALVEHFIATNDANFMDYLDKRVQAAVRAKVALPGTITKDEYR